VSGYLARRTGDPGLGEELAQETFYRATRAFLGWRGGSPAAWLLAIARNVLADHARSGRPLAELPDSLSAPQAPLEETLHVRETLGRLPAPQRSLLERIYVDGFSHAEIAAMRGTTPAAIKTAAWRVRQAFQDLYAEERDDE
jgi:RNA polymerase sigma-70 factor (ECF subfamily)